MPARRLRPNSRHVFTLVVLLCVAATVEAQTTSSSVTLTGRVSETVALSVPPTLSQPNARIDVVSSGGNIVRITVSGNDAESSVIPVPLLVRSNTGFKVSALFESTTAELSQLSVVDVHSTGALASPQLIDAVKVKPDPGTAQPMLVLSGPRVSFGGTLQSPNNALRATLLIHLQPHPPHAWQIHLTLVGTAERLIQ
jgi:hypothetical protein